MEPDAFGWIPLGSAKKPGSQWHLETIMVCHLSAVKAKRYKQRDAISFILPSTFQSLKSTLRDSFEILPINWARAGKRGSRCEMLRLIRRSEMGTSGVDAKLRPRCKPFMAELSSVAGSGNLRCTGCTHREAICHFGRHSSRTDAARKQSALAVR